MVGCGSQIQNQVQVTQTLGTKYTIGVGEVVAHVDKKSNFKNAFGKADVFGRTTDKGYSKLRFAGLDNSGNKIFHRKDIDILINETTMSKTPIAYTSGHANTNFNYNTANTNYSSTTVLPQSDYHMVSPSSTIKIKLPKNENKLYFEGHTVTIIKATTYSLEYKISK